ncbi:acyltransferase family protein [Streptococcus caprae]|uniref:Acyltransferase family protein n=1 Tax=Streptococcus caprae TaxID=1640501 RepID=A0ABV8CTE9_9STRE
MRIKWFSAVRVMGLLLVLTYHFFKQFFPGGFIGVDVFFTFSGYLITALLLDEYQTKQSFDLVSFLRRRFYRIVPPLVLMVLVTMPFTLLVSRDYLASIGQQIMAAIGFTTNFYEQFIGASYESQFYPHLFLHTWSLAIEVHFYVFWGVLVWFLSKRGWKAEQFRGAVFISSVGLFLISFLSLFIRSFFVDNLSMLYFSTVSRAFPFFLGAIFATMSGIKETTKRYRRNAKNWPLHYPLLGAIGSGLMLILLGFTLNFDHLLTYLFGFILASFFTAVMIYCCRVLSDRTPEAIAEPGLLTVLADISYGVYLFHWPFYTIFKQVSGNLVAVFLTLVFSILFSGLSFYIIEPSLQGKVPKIFDIELETQEYRKPFLITIGILSLLTLGLSVTAPKVGAFETGLLADSLNQAERNLNRTHTLLAGDAEAVTNVMVIGDSVALRASTALQSTLPDAQIDAAVSRNFTAAYEIFENAIQTGTLSKTVVLAVGVNSLYNYEEDIQKFIDGLPDGYRLILVSPYNTGDARPVKARDYELTLAKKYTYVTVADWYETASDHPEIWAGTDGVHFSEEGGVGAQLYADTVNAAIKEASKKAAKGETE